MTIGFGISAALIVVNDFSTGTYKFVYTATMARNKIVFAKGLALLSVLFATCFIILLISFLMGIALYGYSDKYVIFASMHNVFHVKMGQYGLLCFLNYFSLATFISTLIFFLSLFFKSNIAALTTSGILLFFFLIGHDRFVYANKNIAYINIFIAVNVFDIYSIVPAFDNISMYLIVTGSYLSVFAFGGLYRFIKRDFT